MQLEPFGEDREDKRFGMIAQTLMNTFRNTKKRTKPYKLEECTLPGGDQFQSQEPHRQSWQEMKAIAMLMAMGKES